MNNYVITYEQDYRRLIFGVNADSRAIIPAINNAVGEVIYDYNQSIINQVVNGVQFYKGETLFGNLGFYFAIKINNGQAAMIFSQLRPSFLQFSNEIYKEIANFISSNNWEYDYLQ